MPSSYQGQNSEDEAFLEEFLLNDNERVPSSTAPLEAKTGAFDPTPPLFAPPLPHACSSNMNDISPATAAATSSIQPAPKAPVDTLQEHFGFEEFRTGQLEVITTLLQGKDACVFWSTGAGKTLPFQLIAIHLKQIVVIVSPLLSLIEDQLANVNKKFNKNIAISFAASNVTEHALEKIRTGESLLLYVTPESMGSGEFMRHLQHIHDAVRPIALLAVDEVTFTSYCFVLPSHLLCLQHSGFSDISVDLIHTGTFHYTARPRFSPSIPQSRKFQALFPRHSYCSVHCNCT